MGNTYLIQGFKKKVPGCSLVVVHLPWEGMKFKGRGGREGGDGYSHPCNASCCSCTSLLKILDPCMSAMEYLVNHRLKKLTV